MCKLKDFFNYNLMTGKYDKNSENADQFFVDYAVADMLDKENERYEAERRRKNGGYDDDWTKPPKRY